MSGLVYSDIWTVLVEPPTDMFAGAAWLLAAGLRIAKQTRSTNRSVPRAEMEVKLKNIYIVLC